jgi:hypothetical protein
MPPTTLKHAKPYIIIQVIDIRILGHDLPGAKYAGSFGEEDADVEEEIVYALVDGGSPGEDLFFSGGHSSGGAPHVLYSQRASVARAWERESWLPCSTTRTTAGVPLCKQIRLPA